MQAVDPSDTGIEGSEAKPAYQRRNFPLNCWWVAATSAEITTQPLARRLLDLPVVLFRTFDGTVSALQDRCPHRWAPLSLGRVEGNEIVCSYHGMHFGTDGRCTLIPTQERIAANVAARAFPTLERYGYVWIWGGAPELAEGENLPDLSAWDEPGWQRIGGSMPIRANYLMCKENVLDLTHLSFLHRNSAGVTDYDRPPAMSIEDGIVTLRKDFIGAPLGALYRDGLEVAPDRPMNRYTWGSSVSPAVQFNGLRIEEPRPEPGARSEFLLHIVHIFTPETMSSAHYWWAMARDHGRPWDVERVTAMNAVVFNEDKAMLEAIQRTVDADAPGTDPLEISVAADRPALAVRHAIARRVAAE